MDDLRRRLREAAEARQPNRDAMLVRIERGMARSDGPDRAWSSRTRKQASWLKVSLATLAVAGVTGLGGLAVAAGMQQRAPQPTTPALAAPTGDTASATPTGDTASATPSPRASTAKPPPTAFPTPSRQPTTTAKTDSSSGAGSIAPGSRISLQATTSCCTGDYIRHDDSDTKVVISPVDASSSATVKADSTWIVRAGLANSACVSFESANNSGQYLRHSSFQIYLNANDNTSLFAQDATFCPQTGHNGQGYSFQSVNYTNKYLRHFNYTVYAASDGGSNPWDSTTSWTDDTSWLVAQPWG